MAKKKSVIPEIDEETADVAETAETGGKVKLAAAPRVVVPVMKIGYPAADSKTETAHVQAVRNLMFGEMPCI